MSRYGTGTGQGQGSGQAEVGRIRTLTGPVRAT